MVTAGNVNGPANDAFPTFHNFRFAARACRVEVGMHSPCSPKLIRANAEVNHLRMASIPAFAANPFRPFIVIVMAVIIIVSHGLIPCE
jgi:hypothetical protein